VLEDERSDLVLQRDTNARQDACQRLLPSCGSHAKYAMIIVNVGRLTCLKNRHSQLLAAHHPDSFCRLSEWFRCAVLECIGSPVGKVIIPNAIMMASRSFVAKSCYVVAHLVELVRDYLHVEGPYCTCHQYDLARSGTRARKSAILVLFSGECLLR
jgi:hypothetical protein